MLKQHTKNTLMPPIQIRLSQEILTELNKLRSNIEANLPEHVTINQSALIRDLIKAGLSQHSRA